MSNKLKNILQYKYSNNILKSGNNIFTKLYHRSYIFYENWIIPPQNETLLELKRREFKEKTKYLDPKVLYNLSEDEKKDLRDSGYFVDLDNKTLRDIKNFKISFNRHEGKYRIKNFYYNFSLYNTKYYYMDQQVGLFQGDPQFLNKIWRYRSRIKKLIVFYMWFTFFAYINYEYIRRKHIKIRNIIKNKDSNLDIFEVDFEK